MKADCKLSFVLEPLSEDEPVLCVVPAVDGTKLTALVEQFELARQYEPAGGYAGLVPSFHNFGNLGDYFMGQSPDEIFKKEGYYLLGCNCGEVGCWPLLADIVQCGETLAWKNFRQPFRPERDYSSFGPFVFDLDSYFRAVAELQNALPLSK